MHDGGVIKHLSVSGRIGSGGVHLRGTGFPRLLCTREGVCLGVSSLLSSLVSAGGHPT